MVGQKVKVGGKIGLVSEYADKVKVKFDSGDIGLFDRDKVEPIVDDTRLKTKKDMPDSKVMFSPEPSMADPLANPKRKTDRSVGEDQDVLGKNSGRDVMARKEAVKLKEGESEAEAKKDAEAEDECKKKPTHREGGKLVKESEDEAECKKESEDEEDAKPEMRKESEDEEEEEMDDEEKALYRKLKKKGYKLVKAGSSLNPEESESAGTTDGHAVTPGKMTGQKADVFVPSSDIEGKRTQETPMGKSAKVDLTKSPLFVGINKQLDSMEKALADKISSVEKSVNDRLKNMREEIEKTEKAVEKFYQHPFYKMMDNDVGRPDRAQPDTVEGKINKGQVKFTQ
jgi:hypothetical protein